MNQQNILVTGGFGCIGAETTKWLLRNTDAKVTVCSRSVLPERAERVFADVSPERLLFTECDVRNLQRIEEVLDQGTITHVVHMAALQTPDCNAYRDLGLQINLAGTQNLIEAMKQRTDRIKRFVFASSIAVYGPRNSYDVERVPMLAEPNPVNVYGAWKLAGEQISKFFHEDTAVPTISLRPGVLFGPGRDAGLTSAPTMAMKCVALDQPYEIPFHSRQDYQYAPDVGAAVGMAATAPYEGYGVYTLPGRTVDTAEFVETIRQSAAELDMQDRFHISIGSQHVPFICDLEYEPFLSRFPDAPRTSLREAVSNSLSVFSDHVRRGWLTAED